MGCIVIERSVAVQYRHLEFSVKFHKTLPPCRNAGLFCEVGDSPSLLNGSNSLIPGSALALSNEQIGFDGSAKKTNLFNYFSLAARTTMVVSNSSTRRPSQRKFWTNNEPFGFASNLLNVHRVVRPQSCQLCWFSEKGCPWREHSIPTRFVAST